MEVTPGTESLIRLYTLGRFELRSAEPGAAGQLSLQPKRLALLAYLALATPRGFHRRDSLLSLFWPEASQDEARNALRQALHHLRQHVGEDAIETRADDQVALVEGRLWCDAVELEAAIAAGDFGRAVELYQGPFLDAVFVRGVSTELEEWVDRTRTRLRTPAADAARRLSEQNADDGRIEEAIAAARRRCDIEPADEAGERALLALLDDHRGRAEALVEAERFRQVWRQRYELEPSPETEALIEAIRSGARLRERPHVPPAVDAPAGPAAVPPATRRRSLRPAVIVATLLALGIAAWLGFRPNRAEDSAPASLALVDRILVVDFIDRTPQTRLGPLVSTALRVDLAQSSAVRVLTSAQVRAALRLAGQAIEVSIDDSLARVIAIREGAKGFVTGEVHAVGSTIVLAARLVAAPSGDQLAAAREVARDSTDIIGAIERLSRSLRHRIGENLSQVSQSLPLGRVTTSSLTALQKYAEGNHLLDLGDRAGGIALLEQAVAIDSGFATAYRMLGSSYAVLGEPARAAAALDRAFSNRSRLSLRERYLVMGSYYRNATQEYGKAVDAYRSLLALYPNDIAALNNLGLTLTSLGRHAEAGSLFVRVIAADSTLVNVRLVLAEGMAAQGRFADAGAVLDEASRRFPEHPVIGLTRIYVSAAASDWPAAEQHAARRLAAVTASVQRIDALQTLGQIELLTGKLARAQTHLEESMRLARAEASPRKFLWGATVLGWLDLRYRQQPDDARRRVSAALKVYPLRTLPVDEAPLSELAGLMAASGMAREARGLLEVPSDTAGKPAGAAERQYLVGVVDGAEGRWREAVAALRAASVPAQDCPICTLPELAAAEEQAGNLDAAIAAAERYVGTPYIHRFEPDAAYLGETLLRLGRLHERRGHPALAAAAYQKLVELWQEADPVLVARVDSVRTKLARLRLAPLP